MRCVLILCALHVLCCGAIAQILPSKITKLGKIGSSKLNEISGLIPYSSKSDYFWVHNDSGDEAQVYLIDSLAQLRACYRLEGINAVDIEDIAWLSINNEPYILLADIGDNRRQRDTLSLYLFPEPLYTEEGEFVIALDRIKIFKYSYADRKRDAEALFVDPMDNGVYIISKRDVQSTLFGFKLDLATEQRFFSLKPLLTLPFSFATAADISSGGHSLLIKNLIAVYYWNRLPGSNILTTLGGPPSKISYTIEPQGEGIAFKSKESRIFYTISERVLGLDSYLYRYEF